MLALLKKNRASLRSQISTAIVAGLLGINLALAGCSGLVTGNNNNTSQAPAILTQGAANVTKSSAQIQWTTNIATTSQVQYGTTASYGSTTALDSTMVTSHSVALSTLTANQTYHFRVVSSANGQQVTGDDLTFTTASNTSALAVSTGSLPAGTVGTTYSSSMQATGGQSPYTWTITSGTMALGLTLSSSGVISGTPTTSGTASFTVQAKDAANATAVKALTLTVATAVQSPTVSTNALAGGTVGTAYSVTLGATGGKTPYTWSTTTGSLPAGLTLSSSGAISGTPTTAGSAAFTVQVKDANNLTGTKSLNIAVVAATTQSPTVSTATLSAGTVGNAYSSTLSATGGTTPYSWSLTSGTLPAGLTLSSGGAISGTPTAAGTASFTAQVKDTKSQTGSKALSIVVNPKAAVALSINGAISLNATSGVPYSSTDSATGGTLPYTWTVTAGNLPTGLSLTSTTGNISGTPTTNGQYTFTLQVADSSSTKQTASSTYTVTISSSTLDQYGGLTTMPSANPATGQFRVEKFANKKWLFVDPANNGFFMIAPYVLAQDNSNDDMGSNYYARTNLKYGDNGPTWGMAQVKRIQSWGFNSVGPYASAYVQPIATDPRWTTSDHTSPAKIPFIALVRPAFYGMANQNNWSPQPIKNLLYGLSSYYTGYRPGNGVADYYDPNLTTFFTNELANDPLPVSIKASPYKNYLIGVNADDSDEMFGFGKGPDFPGGYNNSHLGWMVLTTAPTQTANSAKKFVYPDTVVYSKRALRDQLAAKYGTIAALNSAWGSNYTTFDSSGTQITGESLGTGNGSTTNFTKLLANLIPSKFSVQIFVAGKAVAGDTGTGTIWGPTASGTINYLTGALSVTFSSAPASNAPITVNYIQNGWGIGTGLMDEDGRPLHQIWAGIDFVFLSDTNATAKADLDEYLFQIASHYFSMCRNGIQNWLPGTLYLGPDTLGSWGAPSNRNVLKAAAQYIDVMAMGGTPAMSQSMIDFIYTYYGDKPFYTGEFRTANGDSAFFRYTANATNFTTQPNRGQSYYNGVTPYPNMAYTANGSRPYVGILWWQYLDNWGEKNDWGLVSMSDNAYDGHEATTGTGGVGVRSIPCSPPLENYTCGGEEKNYGNLIQVVTQAHQAVMQAIQK